MDALSDLQVVLAHDWLFSMRGGEKVLEAFCQRWPDAPLYTLLHKPGAVSPVIEDRPLHTSFLQDFPRVERYYRHLLPLMPRAVNWRLPDCDLVLSSSHCVVKGLRAPAGVPHVCYCHTPMRYAWHMHDAYFKSWGGPKRWLTDWVLGSLRGWDRRVAKSVTHFVANSRVVQQRIRECYGRDSVVIHPPVDTDFYTPGPEPRDDYYLVLSAFAPYKRLDLAIEACQLLGKRLVVIGAGQDEKRLRSLAGPRTHFLGWQPDDVLRDHLRRCQALLFPGEEDFGIVPVEAQACGTPVIALAKGGATETVVPLGQSSAPTGVWFAEQTVESLAEAIETFERERGRFDARKIRQHAVGFRAERFEREMFGFIESVVGVGKTRMRRAA